MEGHPSPQAAALAGWSDATQVRVVSVDVRGDRAEVVLDTDPSLPYWVYCVRSEDGWHETVTGNGPTVGWDDPNEIQWSP